MQFVRIFTVVVLVSIVGCGGSEPDTATLACEDFVDAVVERGVECGLPGGALRRELLDSLGGCDRFTRVRNETQLRSTCFDYYETVSCSHLTSGGAQDASCNAQFSRTAHVASGLGEPDAGYEDTSVEASLVSAALESVDEAH